MRDIISKIKFLVLGIIAFYSLSSCEKRTTLNPKQKQFSIKDHLKHLDGTERFPTEVREFLKHEQKSLRKIAGINTTKDPFSPESNPKFPLPYFLIPDEMAQFIQAQSASAEVQDQLILKISGKKHYKFFIHPKSEEKFEFLRSVYNYVGVDRTEFYASPTSNTKTLLVWNRNNEKRKPFIAIINSLDESSNKNLDVQMIKDVPIFSSNEKGK